MKNISAFDHSNLTTIRSDINKALQTVGNSYGVTLTLGNCRFDSNVANFKLAVTVNQNGKTVTPYEAAWHRSAHLLGLKKSWLGKSFTESGTKYKVVGLKPGSRKGFVVCEHSKGGLYKFSPYDIQIAFKAA